MDLDLKNKKALVCASSKGLGYASAVSLAQEGADVFLTARNEQVLQKAASTISNQVERQVDYCIADLASHSDRQHLFERAVESLGQIDILIANAGGPPPGPFVAHGPENWKLAMDLAVGCLSHLSALVLPGMQQRKFGRIVQIVSIAALEVIDGLILSNASRPAVLGLAKALAWELGDSGVLINSVCPGIFLTDRIRALAAERAEKKGITKEQYLAELGADVPLRRPGDPRELGDLVAFLASARNTYINGAAITIDGGKTRRLY